MVHTSFVSTHLVNSLNFRWNNERHKFQSMRPKTTTFKTTLYIRCCASDTTQPKRTTSDQADKATKKLYRPIDYPINTEAYLSSENIRESLWKFTYERTQREEEADRNLQLLADEFQTMRKSVEEALLEQGVDPVEAFQEADDIFTPMEEVTKDAVQAAIERGCPPDDIDLGDYPYIDVPDIPENLELENLGWVGLKELGASPLPEMIEDIQSRRKGVAGGNRSEMERLSEELEETDLASTCSVPEIPQENKIYVKEGLGWRIGYEPFSQGEQCATVGSKDYLIAMNRDEFFHFRRLLMSLDHKLTDMIYHSSELEEELANNHFVMEQNANGMEVVKQSHPILDLESDVLRVQAFGRPSWFSLRVVLKGKRPAECLWDAEATQGLLKAIHEVDHVASIFMLGTMTTFGWTRALRRCALATLLGTCVTWVHAEQLQDTSVLKQRAEKVISKAKESLSLEAQYKQKAVQIIQKYYQQERSKSDAVATADGSLAVLHTQDEQQQGIPAEAFFKESNNTFERFCVPMVIVGGGTAAWSALEAIYEKDPSAQVLVITEEPYAPYNRTPLSKEMWSHPCNISVSDAKSSAKAELEYKYHLPNQPESYRASIMKNVSVTQLYPKENKLKLSNGMEIFYQKLLLATGGKPSVSELVNTSAIDPRIRDSIVTFRNIADFEHLYSSFVNPKHRNITILGGGFLGSELACSLQTKLKQHNESSKQITLLCPEAGVLGKFLPRYLSDYVTKQMKLYDIDVRPGVSVFDVVKSNDTNEHSRIQLQLFGWKENQHITDQVVIAVGITPRQELAEEAGLETDPVAGGIRVNAAMQVEDNIYAAGDVASFWDRALGRRRVEHWDHAVVTGRIAGENMSGGHATYDWESMFWCDLDGLNISFEATGVIDASLRTVGVWSLKNSFRRGEFSDQELNDGVVWYLRGNQVVGALLWNREGKGLDTARQVIGSRLRINSVQDLTSLIPVQDENSKQPPFVIDTSILGNH